MMMTLLSFTAEDVETHIDGSSPDPELYMIAFSVGDVEVDGHSWNFSRGFDEDENDEKSSKSNKGKKSCHLSRQLPK